MFFFFVEHVLLFTNRSVVSSSTIGMSTGVEEYPIMLVNATFICKLPTSCYSKLFFEEVSHRSFAFLTICYKIVTTRTSSSASGAQLESYK